MVPSEVDLRTDFAWEEWGKRDPYYGVITKSKFRRQNLNDEAKADFFLSGRMHVDLVMRTVRKFIDPEVLPKSVLDFGCGVGRMLVAFADIAQQVVGADVSPSMLEEARRNCDEQGLRNVSLVLSDDSLTLPNIQFDLIHSFIVFQHVPPDRGRMLFSRLLEHLSPGGVAAIHFLYSKAKFAATHGSPPATHGPSSSPYVPTPPERDPDMQMNPYAATELLFRIQTAGIPRTHIEFTNHGNEFGLFLFFQKPSSDLPAGSLTPF